MCYSKREENGLPFQKNDEIGGKHLNSEDYLMQMDGQGVFRFAIKQVPEVIQEVLEKNEVKPERNRLVHFTSGEPENSGSRSKTHG